MMSGPRDRNPPDVEPCSTPTEGSAARLDDPLNRVFRAPVARAIAGLFREVPFVLTGLTLAPPLLAAMAGYAASFPDRTHVVYGALLFEARTMMGAIGRALARARGERPDPRDASADTVGSWLAAALLFAGIFWHFRLYAPPPGPWSRYLSPGGVLLLAVVPAALRAVAADHFARKHAAALEQGREAAPIARLFGVALRVSNGNAFLSLVTLAMLTGNLWESQLFFALAGVPWLLVIFALSARFEGAAEAPEVERLEP